MERNWFVGCNCGANFYVKNAAIVRDGGAEPCESCDWLLLCARNPDLNAGVSAIDCLVSTELGWCGCGDPAAVDTQMMTYLDEANRYTLEDGERRLLAYIADDLGWTEHGTSIDYPWLTDAGKEALANLIAANNRNA